MIKQYLLSENLYLPEIGDGGLGRSQFSETHVSKYTFDCCTYAIIILNLNNMYLQRERNYYLRRMHLVYLLCPPPPQLAFERLIFLTLHVEIGIQRSIFAGQDVGISLPPFKTNVPV